MPPTLLSVWSPNYWLLEEVCIGVRLGRKRRRTWKTHFFITHAVLKAPWRCLGPSWRPLGGCLEACFGVLETSWGVFGAPWRRLEASCRLANDFKSSWRRLGGILWRLEAVLEASWRHLGGVSELPWRFVDFPKDFQPYERLVLIGFKDELR